MGRWDQGIQLLEEAGEAAKTDGKGQLRNFLLKLRARQAGSRNLLRGCGMEVALTEVRGSRSSQPPDLGAGHTGTTPPKPLEDALWPDPAFQPHLHGHPHTRL